MVREIRDGLALGALLAERLAWGCLFAATRVADSRLGRRLAFAALAPLLPALLLARLIRRQIEKKQPTGRLLAVSPLVLLLLTAWSLGETLGDSRARPN